MDLVTPGVIIITTFVASDVHIRAHSHMSAVAEVARCPHQPSSPSSVGSEPWAHVGGNVPSFEPTSPFLLELVMAT